MSIHIYIPSKRDFTYFILSKRRCYFKMTLYQIEHDNMLIFPKLSYGRSVFTHTHVFVCVRVHAHTYRHIFTPSPNILFPHLSVPIGDFGFRILDQYCPLIGQGYWRIVRAHGPKNGENNKKKTHKKKGNKNFGKPRLSKGLADG